MVVLLDCIGRAKSNDFSGRIHPTGHRFPTIVLQGLNIKGRAVSCLWNWITVAILNVAEASKELWLRAWFLEAVASVAKLEGGDFRLDIKDTMRTRQIEPTKDLPGGPWWWRRYQKPVVTKYELGARRNGSESQTPPNVSTSLYQGTKDTNQVMIWRINKLQLTERHTEKQNEVPWCRKTKQKRY